MSTLKELAYKPRYVRRAPAVKPPLESVERRNRLEFCISETQEAITEYRMLPYNAARDDLERALSALRCHARNLAAASADLTSSLLAEKDVRR